jgi:myosin heavy subunit
MGLEQLHTGSFDTSRVCEQLRSGGVLEAVRVARMGYSVRYSYGCVFAGFSLFILIVVNHSEFADRFAMLIPERNADKSTPNAALSRHDCYCALEHWLVLFNLAQAHPYKCKSGTRPMGLRIDKSILANHRI